MSNVNHPAHYNNDSGVECIDVIRLLPLSLGTALKYLWRFRDKGAEVQDIDKALWCLKDFEDTLFKNSVLDGALHTMLTTGANVLFNTKYRTYLRQHIVFLERQERPEASAFSSYYQFLRAAQHGVVDLKKYQKITSDVENLRNTLTSLDNSELVGVG